ncbi:hypothetical protein ACFSC6_08770 [Rufibacter sediminis]|uniref:DUF4968 domain-containing protein n=1 Tax=Rufibacter sediminis TaxID=2762756 RepID=A0ABR6VZL4_9BACT|nr:hypothetical protein [Rufibacter sediminis]MBC3542016.1 hypothetical protein [Rufibacter sediminis]
MPAKNRNAFLVIGFLIFLAIGANAQSKATAYLTEEGNLSFKISKPTFQIILSPKGKITNYVINADGDIDFDLEGRLKKMGTIDISYDFNGRINRIGTEQISYDFDNRVTQIGTTKISYSFITGKVSNISG